MKTKPRNIKVTKEQMKLLEEAIDPGFSYMSNDDTKEFDGFTDIFPDGKLNSEEYGDPLTADEFELILTPQSWNRYRMYGNIYPRTMREGIEPDDIGETGVFNSMELQGNMPTQIPPTVMDRLQKLLQSIEDEKLTPKKKVLLLNMLVPKLAGSNTNYPTQKNLDKNIKNSITNNKSIPNSNQLGKEIGNKD